MSFLCFTLIMVLKLMRHLELMAFLGIPNDGTDLEFPLLKSDAEELKKLKLPVKPGQYICIHPGSRGNWRQWPPLYFAGIRGLLCKKWLSGSHHRY